MKRLGREGCCRRGVGRRGRGGEGGGGGLEKGGEGGRMEEGGAGAHGESTGNGGGRQVLSCPGKGRRRLGQVDRKTAKGLPQLTRGEAEPGRHLRRSPHPGWAEKAAIQNQPCSSPNKGRLHTKCPGGQHVPVTRQPAPHACPWAPPRGGMGPRALCPGRSVGALELATYRRKPLRFFSSPDEAL